MEQLYTPISSAWTDEPDRPSSAGQKAHGECSEFIDSARCANYQIYRLPQHETCDGCGKIVANDWPTSQRIRLAANQVAQLIKNQDKNTKHCDVSLRRLKTIFRLYRKIIEIGPLDDNLGSVWGARLQRSAKQANESSEILESRQQVLLYIENLSGYCDSINQLRMILKSCSMISVMDAYSKVIRAIRQDTVASSSPSVGYLVGIQV